MRFLLVTFALLFSATLPAQQAAVTPKAFFLRLGAGPAFQTLRDRAMSPLIYSGIQGAYGAGFDAWRPHGLYRLDVLFHNGTASASSGRRLINYTLNIDGSYLRTIPAAGLGEMELRAGGALTSWMSFRIHQTLVNSYVFYDVFFSLGPSASLNRPFRLLRSNWQAEGQMTVPLLAAGARPSYSGLERIPFIGDDSPDLKYLRFGSLNIVQTVKLRLELALLLNKGNRIGLVYHGDLLRSNLSPHLTTQYLQSLQFQMHVRF